MTNYVGCVVAFIVLFAPSVPAFATAEGGAKMLPQSAQKLEAFVTTYTNVYFALGACDGFIAPEEEAPFDPFGPMLAQWPDSFKHQMSQYREDGKAESLRLVLRNHFTRAERAELCRSQWDGAKADLNQLLLKYVR